MSPARRRRRSGTAPSEEPTLSAAQRFATFRADQEYRASERSVFVESLSFTPDNFQLEAMAALEDGVSVLVAAPTGAGKTVVGEFATHLARSRGRRAFYTTPIKALSNQKYLELTGRHGVGEVGLLTGDTSINPDAPVVVMTTEVLRNMLYAGADLTDLDQVVLDEVHYLSDRFRGPVWEEVIIHLPEHVSLVALSATVSNAEEFGAWMGQVRGDCRVVVSEARPVPLYQHMMVEGRLLDLLAPGADAATPKLNPELLAAVKVHGAGMRGRNSFQRRGRDEAGRRRHRESRPEVVLALERAGLLPAIVFIFSRAGCDEAVRSLLTSGVVLTDQSEDRRIGEEIDEVLRTIPVEDHQVLGIPQWSAALRRGIAAHHAGLLPAMKEAVERLFARGLVKVVFATETLALGINMPARTVVIEQLRKWNGAAHVPLTPGEYTQLSGRAGRRGIDTEGHAVVLHRGVAQPEEVSQLASKRTYPLLSAFHPTYNMVVNLLAHSTRATTREVLENSFAQYQADGAVVELAQRARACRRRLDSLTERMECSQGDAREYFDLRERISRSQKRGAKEVRIEARSALASVIGSARPGDVLSWRRGRRLFHALVLERLVRGAQVVALRVLGTDGRSQHLTVDPSMQSLTVTGHVALRGSGRGARAMARRTEALREIVRSGTLAPLAPAPRQESEDVEEWKRQLRAHPVHRCPHREQHAGAGHEWARTKREHESLLARIEARTNSVAKDFDRVCLVLEELGMIRGDEVTGAGVDLRRVFGERALVVVEALREGVWDELDAAELAAVMSTCVFEPRADGDVAPRVPEGEEGRLALAWRRTLECHARVSAVEERAGLIPTPVPDAGLMEAMFVWARGGSLSTALLDAGMQGGDFVRWARQVLDLLDQVARIEAASHLADRIAQARRLLLRGVVAWQAV